MIERALKLAIAGLAPLLLLGCLLTPGKFVSSLDVAKDGVFTFRYQGELILMTSDSSLDSLAEKNVFAAHCEDEDQNERDCTTDEAAEQKRAWDAEQTASAEKEAKQSAEAAAMLGGIDPKNESTMTEFAARLQREAGWKTVTHRGGGVFDVDYEMSGKLDRDFIFPIFPRFNFIVPAVMITRRDDNAVLIRAPGFGDPSPSGSGAIGAPMGMGSSSKAEGIFTLRTDAGIATNNSEEGAVTEAGRQRVQWKVTPLNRTPPEALIRLTR